jgi:hypothetical protein
MFLNKFIQTLTQAALALALLGGAGAATAASSYHVDIDTSSYAGTGYLDLSLLGFDASPAATASLSNFSGSYGNVADQSGAVSGSVASTVVIGNSASYNDLFQQVTLGGVLSFDIAFSGAYASSISEWGSAFAIGLLDSTQTSYLGNTDGNLVVFSLTSANGVDAAGVSAAVLSNIATVSAVPEASEWLMVAVGLFVVGLAAHRRRLALRMAVTRPALA